MSKRKAIDALGIGPGVGPDGVGARFNIFGLGCNNHMYCAARLFITDLRPGDFALERYSSVRRYRTCLKQQCQIEIGR
jgi:hypothetical protein